MDVDELAGRRLDDSRNSALVGATLRAGARISSEDALRQAAETRSALWVPRSLAAACARAIRAAAEPTRIGPVFSNTIVWHATLLAAASVSSGALVPSWITSGLLHLN